MESSSFSVDAVRSEVSERSRKARWNGFSEFLARRRRPKRVRVLKRRNAIRSVQLSTSLGSRGTSWNAVPPTKTVHPFRINGALSILGKEPGPVTRAIIQDRRARSFFLEVPRRIE